MTILVGGGGGVGPTGATGPDIPGLAADGETLPGATLVGDFIANTVNGRDHNTLNSFDGGITVGDQGISVTALNGVDALDVYVKDGGGVARLCFRANADMAWVRVANATQLLVDVDGTTVHGKFRSGTVETANVGASTGKRMPVYDEAGSLLGYVDLRVSA